MSRAVVTGIPGSGKDHLLSQAKPLLDKAGFTQINFGEAMQSYASKYEAIDRDTFENATKEYIDNLVEHTMSSLVSLEGSTILNTHVVYRQEENYVFNPRALTAYRPTHFAYIWTNPAVIKERRMNDHSRNRPEEDMRQIELHQNLGRAATEILAENLGASFILIDNSIDNERQTVVTLHEGLTA